jgi:5-formyltetrahydrofolate cyclo-ligase
MTDINLIKAEARKIAFAARKAAFARGQGQAADLLADLLAAHRGKPLAGYMAMRTEIDPTIAMAAHQGPVGVPVILGPAQPLRFREWSPGCTMVPGDFGALIPQDGAWIDPQVVIVPLVGFDARGYRLGYGGGYYDRTVAALPMRPYTIGIGYSICRLDSIEPQSYDLKLDRLVVA